MARFTKAFVTDLFSDLGPAEDGVVKVSSQCRTQDSQSEIRLQRRKQGGRSRTKNEEALHDDESARDD
jgi:hypothetical protein